MFGMNCRECGRRPGGAYLTAYQIALKYGFRGTEEQWIRSIGTMRSIHVTEESGGTFECDASLGQVLQMMEDGFIPVLITVEGLPAFLSDVTGEVLSFSTSLIRDISGDYYDCYSMSGREHTVQKMTVSGSEGGGGSIGPGSITYNMLHANVRAALDKADSAYQKPTEGIPPTDMTEAVRASLAKADSALQAHQSLSGLIPRSAQATKTVNHTQEVAIDPSGKLYIEPVTAGEVDIEEHTEVLTMTYYDGDNYCSMTSEEIYELLEDATKAVILIDREGRQCNLIVPPSLESNEYTDAKFWTFDNTGADLVIYSVDDNGIVSSTTISLSELYSKPSGGIPSTDMTEAVRTSLGKADSALQSHQSLSGVVPRNQQASKTVNHTQAVAIDNNGKLWVEPTSSGESSGGESNTELITMTEYDGSDYASLEAAEIYEILDAGAKNIVLIDRSGRQCSLIVPPEEVSNDYSVAKFWTFNDTATGLIIYSVGDNGYVTSTTVALTGFYTKPSGGIPDTDLAGSIPATKLAGDIPASKLASAVQTSLGKADSAYQLPLTGMLETDLATESVVISPGQSAGQYVSTRTFDQISQAASDGFAIKPEFWPDNDTTIRGEILDINETSALFKFLDTRQTARIYVFTVTAQGVSVEITTPLNADLLTAKTAAMTQAVGYDAATGGLWTAPGSGPAVPAPTSSDNGKYLGVVNGAYALRSAPSGGGVTIYSVGFVYRSGYWYIQHDGTDIAAEDIFTALYDGDLVQVKDDAGAECELMEINYSPSEGRLVYKSSNMDNDVPEWRMFEIQDEIVQSAPRATVTMTTVDLLSLSDSRTASAVANGFTVDGNTVYTVSGTISGFALATSSLPYMLPGQCIEIRLTVGSSAITTSTWPSWAKLMNGWDGNFSASTYYDIIIDDAGNVFHSTREVTA